MAVGAIEIAGPNNDGQPKLWAVTLTDLTLTDQIAGWTLKDLTLRQTRQTKSLDTDRPIIDPTRVIAFNVL